MILITCNDSSQTSIGFLLNYMKWYVTQEGSGAEKNSQSHVSSRHKGFKMYFWGRGYVSRPCLSFHSIIAHDYAVDFWRMIEFGRALLWDYYTSLHNFQFSSHFPGRDYNTFVFCQLTMRPCILKKQWTIEHPSSCRLHVIGQMGR